MNTAAKYMGFKHSALDYKHAENISAQNAICKRQGYIKKVTGTKACAKCGLYHRENE